MNHELNIQGASMAPRTPAGEDVLANGGAADKPAPGKRETASEVEELQAEIERLTRLLHAAPRPSDDALWDETLRDRDDYHEWADKLANAIAEHLGVEIGEHSNLNMPWLNAFDALASATEARDVIVSNGPAIAWVRRHPDGEHAGELTGDWLWDGVIEQCRKDSGVWFPLGALATRASEAAQALSAWVSVDERLPVAGKPVLFSFLNALGKRRTARGYHAPRHALSANDWEDPDDADVDDQENYWVPEGWWEDPVEIEGLALVRQPVTHWMPLPASPDALSATTVPGGEGMLVASGDAKAAEQSDSPAQAFDPSTAWLVHSFARALAAKLLAAQIKHGYGNSWLDDDWEGKCRADFMKHIAKGDPLDVAAYCAFMWHHNWSTAALASQAAPDALEHATQAAGQWANSNTPVAEALAYRDGFMAGSIAAAQPAAAESAKPSQAELDARVELEVKASLWDEVRTICVPHGAGVDKPITEWLAERLDTTVASKEAVTLNYPEVLTPELREVLGWMCFQCISLAQCMRADGVEIATRAEDEQAVVLHWLTKFVLKHGTDWRPHAGEALKAMRERVAQRDASKAEPKS